MKTMFCASALMSGSIAFVGVYAYRKHQQQKLDRRSRLMSEWFSRPM